MKKRNTDLQDENSEKILSIVKEIKSLHSPLDVASKSFDDIIEGFENKHSFESLRVNAEYWTTQAYRNTLIKLRLIVENNFRYVETLNVLATTRYVFEVLVWIRLLKSDPDFGLVFYWKLIKDQLEHHKRLREKLEREILFFQSLRNEESKLTMNTVDRLLKDDKKPSPDDFSKAFSFVQEEIDRRARRYFSAYIDQAKINGYGFQAHLIETKVIPDLINIIKKIETDRDEFNKNCPNAALKKCKAYWNWKDHAKTVGMEKAYDFIYSYSSRLLHAAPSSILTDQKNLEPDEVVLFLDYTYVSMIDVLDLFEMSVAGKRSIN